MFWSTDTLCLKNISDSLLSKCQFTLIILNVSKEAFLSYLSFEKKYSEHTIVAYKRDITEFYEFCRAHFQIETIEEVDYVLIRSWVVALVDENVSNRTINRKISSLKAYYRFLQRIGRTSVNPLAHHKSLKVLNTIEVPFSEKEMQQVLEQTSFENSFEGRRDKLIIELLYTTGIRRAELINMKINDIDLNRNTVLVLGKRNKERIVPLLDTAIIAFKEYFEKREELVSIVDGSYVFLLKSGRKIYDTLVYRVIHKYISKVSTKLKISPHILRHTFATHLLSKGADINSVKELLGHATLASTQIYARNSISELKRVHQNAHPRSKK